MRGTSDFRDYLYVSARKVVRMSQTLRPPLWKRVRNLQFNLGPVGAGLKLDTDSRAEDVVALVPDVERAIGDRFGIKYFTDPDLRVGHWFLIESVPMIYGVPGVRGDSVLFMGDLEKRFILGGSAEYLLDRPKPVQRSDRWGYSASHLGGLRSVLESMAMNELSGEDKPPFSLSRFRQTLENEASGRVDGDFFQARWRLEEEAAHGDYFDTMREEFGVGQEPLTALVKCLDIDQHTYGSDITIIGTPLYVAFDVPD